MKRVAVRVLTVDITQYSQHALFLGHNWNSRSKLAKVIWLICSCLYVPSSGEFGVVYHGTYTPGINKLPQAVAVKTLKGGLNKPIQLGNCYSKNMYQIVRWCYVAYYTSIIQKLSIAWALKYVHVCIQPLIHSNRMNW